MADKIYEPAYGSVAFWGKEYFEKGYQKSEKSRQSDLSYYNLYIRYPVGDRILREQTNDSMRSYWRDIRDLPLSTGTKTNILILWRDISSYAEEQGETFIPFLDNRAVVQQRRSEHTIAAPEPDVDKVMCSEEAPTTVFLLALARFCGIKRMECIRLRIEDIDTEAHVILISSRTKPWECEEVPYPPWLDSYYERVLKECGRKKDTEWVFARADGSCWDDSKVTKMVRKLLDREGCTPGLSYESFRAAYYADVDYQDQNLTVAKAMMGIRESRKVVWRRKADWRQKMELAEVTSADYLRLKAETWSI